jgi:hypothetical protein
VPVKQLHISQQVTLSNATTSATAGGRTSHFITVPCGYRLVSGGWRLPEEFFTHAEDYVMVHGSFPQGGNTWNVWLETFEDNVSFYVYLICEKDVTCDCQDLVELVELDPVVK